MWPSPRGSTQRCFDVFSLLWQYSLLIHLKGDKKPTKAYSSSCEIHNSSPSKCHIWLLDSREQHYRNRVQLPSIKEPFFLGCQRRKYNCCVILLDLLKMTERSNWIWIRRGVKDFCPVFLPAALGDGRQISTLQYKEHSGITPSFFSLTCLLLMLIFSILKSRGFFIKNERNPNDGKDRARETNSVSFPLLCPSVDIREEYYHCPFALRASRLLGPHTREHLCNSSMWNEQGFFLHFITPVCLLTRLTKSRSSSTVPCSRIFWHQPTKSLRQILQINISDTELQIPVCARGREGDIPEINV